MNSGIPLEFASSITATRDCERRTDSCHLLRSHRPDKRGQVVLRHREKIAEVDAGCLFEPFVRTQFDLCW